MTNSFVMWSGDSSVEQVRRFLRQVLVAGFALFVFASSNCCSAQEVNRPKYASDVVRLYRDHGYLQKHDAPDYWALSPYYASQQNDASCSVAVVAMIVNAMRAKDELRADDQLVTHNGLLEKVNNDDWQKQVEEGGKGVTLGELAGIVEDSLRVYRVKEISVEIVSFPQAKEDRLQQLRQLLMENERSDRDLIVVNVLQGMLTGDPEGMVGHFMPIAAYDAEGHRALMLDPDRRWYEPYWVSDEKLLAAMATIDDASQKPRGLLRVKAK